MKQRYKSYARKMQLHHNSTNLTSLVESDHPRLKHIHDNIQETTTILMIEHQAGTLSDTT